VSDEENNKRTIRRLFDEFVNLGEFSVVDEIYRPDVIDHQPLPGAPEGREGVKYTIARLRSGFPDLHVTIEAMSAKADHVVIHNTMRGTHLGDFLGMPPTGRALELQGVVVWRLANGLIAERWGIGAESNMLSALGMRALAPGPAARAVGRKPGQNRRRPQAGPAVTQILSIRDGQSERWHRLQEELSGSRLREFEASRRRVGIVHESFALQELDGRPLVVHRMEARDPYRAARRVHESAEPFDVWLRHETQDVHGVDPWAVIADDRAASSGHEWTVPVELVPRRES
jgi:steroid delta-isomerase-like uncharacterized protein